MAAEGRRAAGAGAKLVPVPIPAAFGDKVAPGCSPEQLPRGSHHWVSRDPSVGWGSLGNGGVSALPVSMALKVPEVGTMGSWVGWGGGS